VRPIWLGVLGVIALGIGVLLACAVAPSIRWGVPGADISLAIGERGYALQLLPPRVVYTYPRVTDSRERIIIEKGANMLYYYRGGVLRERYEVATGREPHFTPEGSFYVAVKLREPEGPDLEDAQLGSRWLGLAVPDEADRRGPPGDSRSPVGQKYGIHGTDEPASIGTHASGGCIRMKNADVIRLFDQVEVGTPVEVRL
jgi:L,D-transpeptidase YnhG